jgi:hypothetical protein
LQEARRPMRLLLRLEIVIIHLRKLRWGFGVVESTGLNALNGVGLGSAFGWMPHFRLANR